MQNGTGLHGDFSSTNSAIIIPKPEDENIYYIFTVDDIGGINGLQYSTVNMSLANGLGAITLKNTPLNSPSTEKITAVRHQNDIDWWVLSHKWESDEFLAYQVTPSGVNSPISSRIGTTIIGATSNTIGAMKFSPDGTKVALANSYNINEVQLFNFNDVTGVLSNPITLSGFDGTRGAYGIEFSIDSNLLYVSDSGGSIYQYNVSLNTTNQIINSKITIVNDLQGVGALQIAPNGKIYVARENSAYLGVISNPNTIGIGANYIDHGVFLEGKNSKFGLPPFIQSFFWKEILVENTCFGDTTNFSLLNPEVSQLWDFGDPASGVNNNSTSVNPNHLFTSPGVYNINIDSWDLFGNQTSTLIHITISENALALIPQDYILCDNTNDGNDTNGIVQNFLLSSKDNEIIGNINSSQFDVLYYEDINLSQLISKNVEFENTIPFQQTIYAKVFNKDNESCFDKTEFKILVKKKPEFEIQNVFVVCNNANLNIPITNPVDNYNYEWFDPSGNSIGTNQTLTFTDTSLLTNDGTVFTVTATNPTTFCQRTKEITIRKSSIASITQDDITSVAFSSPNNAIEILTDNLGSGDYEFSLEHTSDDHPWQDDPIFTNLNGGVYIVLARDKNGCGQTSLEVVLLDFPKFFTPNNDGYNDYWQLIGLENTKYIPSTIAIYDRFGKLVAQINPTGKGWNGFYNGKLLPEADYWFTVELTDIVEGTSKVYKNHFSLIRR